MLKEKSRRSKIISAMKILMPMPQSRFTPTLCQRRGTDCSRFFTSLYFFKSFVIMCRHKKLATTFIYFYKTLSLSSSSILQVTWTDPVTGKPNAFNNFFCRSRHTINYLNIRCTHPLLGEWKIGARSIDLFCSSRV